jgi:hypothetical protein
MKINNKKQKSKHVSLAQQNGFGSSFWHSLLRQSTDKLAQQHTSTNTSSYRTEENTEEKRREREEKRILKRREECNKYDLTASPCF